MLTHRGKVVFAGMGAVAFTGTLALGTVLFCLAISIHSRLSHRRWKVPSVVYSDVEVLFPGERMGQSDFVRMLRARGYREIPRFPRFPGRFTIRRNNVQVFLRDFAYPDHFFRGFLLTVAFKKGVIWKMWEGLKPRNLLTLEPQVLARLYGKKREARKLISYRETPKGLVNALIAIEDRRFFQHRGLDWRGILRAFWVDVRQRKIVQGGSTITQQLAKNYFLCPDRSLSRKVKEALVAIVLEELYSKTEILEMYMNEIYMGQWNGAAIRGVGEAAWVYFGHGIRSVTLGEAALLAGMVRAPNAYSPFTHPVRAKARRTLVLETMRKLGMIDGSRFRRACQEPLPVSRGPKMSRENLYYVDFLKSQLERLYPPKALTGEGLRIFTALQPEIQEAAALSVRRGLRHLERQHPFLKREKTPLQAAMIVVRPKTGEIIAMVGGDKYASTPYNRAVNARRQPGSVFKPFVYLAALDTVTPASILLDRPVAYSVRGKVWIPRNNDGKYHGRVTVRTALEYSLNAATVGLAMKVGLKKIIKTARGLGIRSELVPLPSLALGAFEMTPLEVARAYSVFANEGQRPFLLTLREVTDGHGKVLQRRHVAARTVCSPARAYLMTSLLKGVVRYGTARRLKNMGIDFPCAGKTGTTSGYRDSWFVGYTSDLLAAVWVGFDDNRSTHLTGATGAMRIWADFMKRIRPRLHPVSFLKPPGVVSRIIRVRVDWPPEAWRSRTYCEDFLSGTAPAPIPREKQEKVSPMGQFIREIWKGLKEMLK